MDTTPTPAPRRTIPSPKFEPGETVTLLQPNGVLVLAKISCALWLPKHSMWKYNIGNPDTPVEEDRLTGTSASLSRHGDRLDVTDLVERARNPVEKPYSSQPAPEPMDAMYPFNL